MAAKRKTRKKTISAKLLKKKLLDRKKKGLTHKEIRTLLSTWAVPLRGKEAVATASKPAPWSATVPCIPEQVYKGKKDRLYRICNDGPEDIEVIVDGKVSTFLAKGTCTDVEGKKIEVHVIEFDDPEIDMNSKGAKGTYEKL